MLNIDKQGTLPHWGKGHPMPGTEVYYRKRFLFKMEGRRPDKFPEASAASKDRLDFQVGIDQHALVSPHNAYRPLDAVRDPLCARESIFDLIAAEGAGRLFQQLCNIILHKC